MCDKATFFKNWRGTGRGGEGKYRQRSQNAFGESGKMAQAKAFWSNVIMREEEEDQNSFMSECVTSVASDY